MNDKDYINEDKVSMIAKVWYCKKDSQLYSYGKNLIELNGNTDLKNTIGVIKDNRRKPADTLFYHFRIAYHCTKDIKTFNVLYPDVDFYQSKIGKENETQGVEFSPIIHILEPEHKQVFFKNEKHDFYKEAPRFRYIMDSGIWNYLVFDKSDFKAAVNEIARNWKFGYYDLDISKEYADLNARLVAQSYLFSINRNNELSGHGAHISPFLFHSESEMKRLRKKEEREFNSACHVTNHKWRILLLDDKIGNSFLQPKELKKTKEQILKERIEKMMGKHTCYPICFDKKKSSIQTIFDSVPEKIHGVKIQVVMLCVDTISNAELALKYYKFDFIFLDYLLEDNHNSKKVRYGYEFLDLLDKNIGKDGKKLYLMNQYGQSYLVGPDQRYYFMFISAFTTAVSERLRLEGWSRSEELWHIAEGACPTNTPQLFLYNLQKMMIKRIKDSGIEHLSAYKIYDLVIKIYGPHKEDSPRHSVRKRANDNYHSMLSLLYYYKRILKDVDIPESGNIFSTKGSVLMTSFIQNHVHFGGLLEHLINLVHLTAFGTVRQWPEMWEEYLYFKTQYQDLYNDEIKRQASSFPANHEQYDFQRLCDCIEQYIIKLKSL